MFFMDPTFRLLATLHCSVTQKPMLGSTLYHLFMCHQSGKFAYLVLLKVDLLGIWFTQTLGNAKKNFYLIRECPVKHSVKWFICF